MRRQMMRLALLSTATAIGFDWKKDGDALATDSDGNPIWINGQNELSVKGDTLVNFQNEAKRNRTRAEQAEAKLEKFNGIDDPDAARTALETVRDLKDGDLISKGRVEEVRNEMTKQFEGRIAAADQARDKAYSERDNVLLDNAFATSSFASNRLTDAGRDLARTMFRDRFKVEGGRVVAYDQNGQSMYSNNSAGELASFDEALERTIGGYKHKDTILKAPDAAGSGGGGGGGQRGQGRTIKRSEFEALPPSRQSEIATGGEVQIVD